MSNESLDMCEDFSKVTCDEMTGNLILEILKRYSSTISVFDMMAFSSQVIEENKYVQESYRIESQKSYIESFLLRINDISADTNDYSHIVDRDAFGEAIDIIKSQAMDGEMDSKIRLIFHIASIYATFVLKESIHPVGTPFPGSLHVEGKNGKFYCPVKEANLETENAVCNICLAEQLDF